MKNEEILAKVLKVEEQATQAYNKALIASEQTSQTAEKKLKALLEQKEAEARAEADALLAAAQQRLMDARQGITLDEKSSKRLADGHARVDETVNMLVSKILNPSKA